MLPGKNGRGSSVSRRMCCWRAPSPASAPPRCHSIVEFLAVVRPLAAVTCCYICCRSYAGSAARLAEDPACRAEPRVRQQTLRVKATAVPASQESTSGGAVTLCIFATLLNSYMDITAGRHHSLDYGCAQ